MNRTNANRATRRTTKAKPEPRPNRCVLVADRARARFFTIDENKDDSGPPLTEREDLVNPEGALTRKENFSDTRGGRRSRSSVGGGGYALDKRIERHEDEFDRRFAREVATGAAAFVRSQHAGQLVVAAASRFLGHLRSQLQRTMPPGVAVVEFPTELTWHTLARIRDKLVQQGLLREKELPEAAYRPRSRHPAGSKKTASSRQSPA